MTGEGSKTPSRSMQVRRRARQLLPPVAARMLGLVKTPPPGLVRFGDLRRTEPIDDNWGFDRGGPVDRYYIEAFLDRHRQDVRGRVLEVGDDSYTRRFGGDRVTRSDVLHIDPDAAGATFVGDLADGVFLPDEAFDTIILTQTLHLIFDFPGALRTLDRVLAPGGVLLLTVPGITPVDAGEWASSWCYSFTEHALARMVGEYMRAGDVEIRSHGNALAAVAFLHGLSADELKPEELDVLVPTHAIVHTARVRPAPRTGSGS